MRKIQWGIISTANIGQEQVIPAIKRATNSEVAAIASRGETAVQVAKELDIPKAYTSYHELLKDENIDAVYIPLPNTLHKEWVIEAAKHKKHVLVEKPAALHAEELEEMIAACKEHGVLFMEAFMYQFQPQHEKVKQLIKDGTIGDVTLMRASFSFVIDESGNNIRLNKELGGGSVYDVGCYPLHSIRHILGEEPTSIVANAKIHPEYGVDMTASGVLTFESGIQAIFDSSFETTFRNAYQLFGNKGSIEVSSAYRPDTSATGEGKVVVSTDDGTETYMIPGEQYTLQVEHFADCILTNQQPSYTHDQMLGQARVMDACFESIKTGNRITL